ncbi:hypothetical protein AAVH_15533 [Aphelenchoides avenae]|nr:hypothetical protein AAVH_15533 [Aphelenchus avenae]
MFAVTEALMLSEITSWTLFHNACDILFACACGFVVTFFISTLFDLIDEACKKVTSKPSHGTRNANVSQQSLLRHASAEYIMESGGLEPNNSEITSRGVVNQDDQELRRRGPLEFKDGTSFLRSARKHHWEQMSKPALQRWNSADRRVGER